SVLPHWRNCTTGPFKNKCCNGVACARLTRAIAKFAPDGVDAFNLNVRCSDAEEPYTARDGKRWPNAMQQLLDPLATALRSSGRLRTRRRSKTFGFSEPGPAEPGAEGRFRVTCRQGLRSLRPRAQLSYHPGRAAGDGGSGGGGDGHARDLEGKASSPSGACGYADAGAARRER
ncbi:MAG: hypothetical protein BJ554DRAFT_2896, partial [Olpidium bornovanus]